MILLALFLLFGWGEAANCVCANGVCGASGAKCTPVQLGTVATSGQDVYQMNIVDITIQKDDASCAAAEEFHQWQIFLTGALNASGTSTVFGATGSPKADLGDQDSACTRLSMVGSACTDGTSECLWTLYYTKTANQTCSDSSPIALTDTCVELSEEAANKNGAGTPTDKTTGSAAKLQGRLYHGTTAPAALANYIHAVATDNNATDAFGAAGDQTGTPLNNNLVDLVVWDSTKNATCLKSGGKDTGGMLTSYKIACNGQAATIYYYTDNACATAASTASKALYTVTGTTTAATLGIVISAGISSGRTGFQTTNNIYFKAEGTVDQCIKLNPPAQGGPASAISTAAAAAVIAGALIL